MIWLGLQKLKSVDVIGIKIAELIKLLNKKKKKINEISSRPAKLM